jgi:hypothetical protein
VKKLFFWKLALAAIIAGSLSLVVLFCSREIFGLVEDVTNQVNAGQKVTVTKYLPVKSQCDFRIAGWVENSEGLGSDVVLTFDDPVATLSGSDAAEKIHVSKIETDQIEFETYEGGRLNLSVDKVIHPGQVYKNFAVNLDCKNYLSRTAQPTFLSIFLASVFYLIAYFFVTIFRFAIKMKS